MPAAPTSEARHGGRTPPLAARPRRALPGTRTGPGRGAAVGDRRRSRAPVTGLALGGAASHGGFSAAMAQFRDPAGFARLPACCATPIPASRAVRGLTVHRAAVIVAAKGGVLGDITTGDVLELLDADDRLRRSTGNARALPDAAASWASSASRPRDTARAAHRRPAHARGADRPLPAGLPPGPRPAGGLPARTPARAGLHQPGVARGHPRQAVLGRPRAAPPRHRQPAPARRRRRRLEAAAADGIQDDPAPSGRK